MTEHRAAAVVSRALRVAILEGKFRAGDIRRGLDDPPSSSTITRILRQLEADSWLSRNEDGSDLWRAGSQARMLCDLSDAAEQAAAEPATQPGEEKTDPFDNFSL